MHSVPDNVLATRAAGVIHRVGKGGQGPEHLRWQSDGEAAKEDREAWRRREAGYGR